MSKETLAYIAQLEEFILNEANKVPINIDKYPLLEVLQIKKDVVVPAILRAKKKLD